MDITKIKNAWALWDGEYYFFDSMDRFCGYSEREIIGIEDVILHIEHSQWITEAEIKKLVLAHEAVGNYKPTFDFHYVENFNHSLKVVFE